MNLETLSVVVFFGVIGFLIYLDKKNIEFKKGLAIRRTKKGIKIISEVAKKHRKILRIVGNFAVGLCIVVAVVGLFFLVRGTFSGERSAGVILPTVGEYRYPEPVYSVPFWYWIIAIFIIVTIHEPMHALFARLERVKIKDMGILLFFVLPLGAFADPDEKQMKKLSTIKKLRIFAAGSFGNIIVAGIFILLIMSYDFLVSSLIGGRGVIFEKTIENTGAQETGLTGIINEIDGKEIKSLKDLSEAMEDVDPGDMIEVKTSKGIFQIKTTPNPEDTKRPFIGISMPKTLFVYKGFLKNLGVVSERTLNTLFWILGLLEWIFILSLGVGVFNLFPIKPLDGGLMLEEIIKHFYKGKYVSNIVNGISLLVLSLLLTNLFGPSLLV